MTDDDRAALIEIISTNSNKWAAVVDSVKALIKTDGLEGVAEYIVKKEDIMEFNNDESDTGFEAMALSTMMSLAVQELWERDAFMEDFS